MASRDLVVQQREGRIRQSERSRRQRQMCIRDRDISVDSVENIVYSFQASIKVQGEVEVVDNEQKEKITWSDTVSYTHLRAHETPEHLVCRLLLEKKTLQHTTVCIRDS
ncbi:hypothetical protein CDFC105_30472 [Clostridioides difficile]|nr:hypothetical protein CDFC105_30472 [Clostridioides difficile]